jgi:hypothetical protein
MGIYPERTLGRFLAMRRTERSPEKLCNSGITIKYKIKKNKKNRVREMINHLA